MGEVCWEDQKPGGREGRVELNERRSSRIEDAPFLSLWTWEAGR